MKISYNWLKSYVNTNKTPEEISRILTDTGLEVEGLEKIETIKNGLQGVVIGEVMTCVPHGNADKLQVTAVDIGAENPVQIVCGAPNVKQGIKVVVATVGTTLYPSPTDPFKIKKSKIRGVESEGMICAEDELGLGKDHDGIMILPSDAKVGQPAKEYFQIQEDYIIEIGLTPNRSDAMGHIGVARDLVAYLNIHERANLKLEHPDTSDFKVDNTKKEVTIEVEDAQLAPRYAGVTIDNIEIKPSPDWLKNRLMTIGLVPINNVVDVTNFVLHEMGTPLHAFDLDEVGNKIVVKTAQEKDEFVTLDGEKRTLNGTDLMITNGEKHLCMAGVFGGADSGVKDKTTSIFLEAAYFNPVTIRKTAKYHGLNTDASFRFERGVDPNAILEALKRAAMLIKELAGGEISMEPVDLYPNLIEKAQVTFSFERCNKLIGKEIPKGEVYAILENLDIHSFQEKDGLAYLEIPTYRNDVTREADVIEEVLRIYGFNNVPEPDQFKLSLTPNPLKESEIMYNRTADALVALGFHEVMNNSLTQSEYTEQLSGDLLNNANSIHMLNPLSKELDIMRRTLVFQLLESVAHNQNRQHPNVKLFEFGKVYHRYDEDIMENKRLILGIAGEKYKESWNNAKGKVDFYDLKAYVNTVIGLFGLEKTIRLKEGKKSSLENSVELYAAKFKIGEMGWANAKMKKHFGIKNPVFIADLDWDQLLKCLVMNKVKFSALPKTFAVRRDFSLLLDNHIQFDSIQSIARKVDKHLLKSVDLFDVYEGDNLPEGKKSYAVSFTFQDEEKTLKDKQIDKIMDKIRGGLEKELAAELR
jgi:phenylalanyl-tRNA synthetase beta chain